VIRPLARQGDIRARPSANGHFVAEAGSATGTWTAPDPALTLLAPARAATEPLVASASCTFRFKGTLDAEPHTVVTGSSSVRLVARPTVVRVGGADVLRDGDQASDTFGNRLVVASAAPWRSA